MLVDPRRVTGDPTADVRQSDDQQTTVRGRGCPPIFDKILFSISEVSRDELCIPPSSVPH